VISELLRAQGACPEGDAWRLEEAGRVCRLQIRSTARGRHSATARPFLEISTRLAAGEGGVWDDRRLALLNARAVGGCYGVVRNRLSLRAQLPLADEAQCDGHLPWLINAVVRSQRQLTPLLPQHLTSALRCASALPRFGATWKDPVPDAAWLNVKQTLDEDDIAVDLTESGVAFELPLGDQRFFHARRPRRNGAVICITTACPHPLVGAGYLATIRLPVHAADHTVVTKLNRMELRTERLAPRLGAWGLREGGTAVIYSQFLPTDRARIGLEHLIARWMIARVRWLRRRVWKSAAGFCL